MGNFRNFLANQAELSHKAQAFINAVQDLKALVQFVCLNWESKGHILATGGQCCSPLVHAVKKARCINIPAHSFESGDGSVYA